MREFIRNMKASYLLASVLYVVLGLVLAVWPDLSMSLTCTAFGLVLVVYGVITIISFLVHDSHLGTFRLELVLGILALVLGLFFLLRPDVVLSILPVMLGLYIMIDALLNVKRALELKGMEYGRWWVILVLSLVSAALGLTVVLRPLALAGILFRVVGCVFLYTGLSDLWALFKLGRVARAWKADHPIEVDPIDIQ